MADFPKKLDEKLSKRKVQNTLRHLPGESDLVDFSSNDYLGFARNREIFGRASQLLGEKNIKLNGATGSRLLSGNHPLYSELEEKLAEFHQTGAALVFNSGYDANIGFFGCVPQRGDIVLFDEYIHASIRDGIKMGNAKSYKFKHNDVADLKKRAQAASGSLAEESEVYVVTESVFSMDGDSPDLKALAEFCRENNFRLVVDEAHAIGVFGKKGEGLVQQLGLQDAVFARIVTFGKAMGCHGAAILGNKPLMDFLVNFARSLMYTTGLPPHSVATILASYEYISASGKEEGLTKKHRLAENLQFFNLELASLALSESEGLNPASTTGRLQPIFIPSSSAIHCCIIPGNEQARGIAQKIQKEGFEVRAILSPTVPEGRERLRICLHSFNTKEEIGHLLKLLSHLIKNR